MLVAVFPAVNVIGDLFKRLFPPSRAAGRSSAWSLWPRPWFTDIISPSHADNRVIVSRFFDRARVDEPGTGRDAMRWDGTRHRYTPRLVISPGARTRSLRDELRAAYKIKARHFLRIPRRVFPRGRERVSAVRGRPASKQPSERPTKHRCELKSFGTGVLGNK